MFTGIVQATGLVQSLQRNANGARLALAPVPGWALASGESVAVNGCCLTALPGLAAPAFDLSQETLERTSLGGLRQGDTVNLERALRAGDALGGHFMAGHVDGLAQLVAVTPQGDGAVWRLRAPQDLARFVAHKGSVALDGVSLTPYDVTATDFSVALIPHTFAATNYRERKPGDSLNLEIDLLARYMLRLMETRP